jgi:hypothetical protein
MLWLSGEHSLGSRDICKVQLQRVDLVLLLLMMMMLLLKLKLL